MKMALFFKQPSKKIYLQQMEKMNLVIAHMQNLKPQLTCLILESQISQSSSHDVLQQVWEEEKLNHEIDNLKSGKSVIFLKPKLLLQ